MVNSEYKYSKIRYYTIEMLKLHNYKFLDALYLHLYNNDYIALASNYCLIQCVQVIQMNIILL